jgi:hypothetical protein
MILLVVRHVYDPVSCETRVTQTEGNKKCYTLWLGKLEELYHRGDLEMVGMVILKFV